MLPTLEPVRAVTLAEIQDARARIAKSVLRTPLIRLDLGPEFPDVRLKLENLQPTNSYKLRGAVNAVSMLSEAERERGVWTISAGNAGQGVAYAARQAGVPCTVVAIETAPQSKIERMRALGARLIPVSYATAWKALGDRAFPGVVGTFVHPFDDHNFIAGHASMGLEIRGCARHRRRHCGDRRRRFGHRRGQRPEGARSRDQGVGRRTGNSGSGRPVPCGRIHQPFKDWTPSFVDGAGGQSVFPRMWERMRPLLDGCIVVTLEDTKRAMRLVAEKARIIAEGAGALAVAAALTGKAGRGPLVAVVSGGNVDLPKFCELIAGMR